MEITQLILAVFLKYVLKNDDSSRSSLGQTTGSLSTCRDKQIFFALSLEHGIIQLQSHIHIPVVSYQCIFQFHFELLSEKLMKI